MHDNNFRWFGFCSNSHTLPPQRETQEKDIKRNREQKHWTLTITAAHGALSPPAYCMNKLKDKSVPEWTQSEDLDFAASTGKHLHSDDGKSPYCVKASCSFQFINHARRLGQTDRDLQIKSYCNLFISGFRRGTHGTLT